MQTEPEEMVTITKKEYESLLDDAKWRQDLEIGRGRLNWDWYHDSLKDGGYFDDEEDEE